MIEQQFLYCCLQSALMDKEKIELYNDDLRRVLSEARAQKVSALVCAGLTDGTELRKDYIANVYAFYRLIAVQGELTELLAARGILPVILKGTACGAAYPRPELRAYGDIDFRVAPGRFDEALEVLTQNGFRVTEEIHEYTRHVDLEKGGVMLEFHRYWCGSDSWEAPANGSEFNERVMNAEAVPAEIMGKRFYMLPTLENGLVILQHINHHIVNGLGLRQIIDFMMYVRANVTDGYWNAEFGPAAKRYGMDKLAVNVAHMCTMYLGLEERDWYAQADENTCREFMEYILSSGNFGRKLEAGTGRHVQEVLASNNTLKGWLKRFRESGIVHWKAAEEHKLLRPLAGFYGFSRYVALGISRKGAVGKLKNEFGSAKKHRKLLRKLRNK